MADSYGPSDGSENSPAPLTPATPVHPLRRFAILLAYDGAMFRGWQLQNSLREAELPSTQGALEAALSGFTGHPVRVMASGRTDAGVHALGQVVHADLHTPHSADILARALAIRLPVGLSIRRMAEVPLEFDARRAAIRRTYTYRLVLGPPASGVLVRQRAGIFAGQHDIHAMAQAAALLPGHHDFAGFRNSDCNAKRTDLTLETSHLAPLSDDSRLALSIPPEADALIYTIACRSFLMHMVRRIVGSLVLVGRGKLSLDEIRQTLLTGTTPARTLLAPAAGLVLHRVDYPEDPFHLPNSQP